jgi:hypothetical protein
MAIASKYMTVLNGISLPEIQSWVIEVVRIDYKLIKRLWLISLIDSILYINTLNKFIILKN